jgi:hypothetical protein
MTEHQDCGGLAAHPGRRPLLLRGQRRSDLAQRGKELPVRYRSR